MGSASANRPPENNPARICIFSTAASGLAIMAGLLVLAGWLGDIDRLKRVLPGLVAMNPVTALAFCLAGIALWLRRTPVDNRAGDSAARIRRSKLGGSRLCAGLVMGIGVLRLVGYESRWDFGIDQLLFTEKLLADGAVPNRMAPNTAFNFALLGLALLLVDVTTRKGRRPAEFLAAATALISFLALLGYAYQVRALYGVASFIPMALPTAAVFFLLSLGLLCARPDRGLMAVMTGDSSGGAMARRLIPTIVLVFAGLGWLRLEGERRGFYGADWGVTFYTVASIAIFGALIAWSAAALHRADTARQATEKSLEHERYLLAELMDNVAESIYFKDRESRFTRINRALAARFGLGDSAAAVGRTDFDFFTEEHARPAFEDEQRVMRTGQAIAKEEKETWPDGRTTWVLSAKLPLRDKAGHITGTFGLSRDITDRKQMEDALRQAHDALETRVQERTAELARVNRELRDEMAERARAEEVLRESEARVRLVIDTALDAVITMSAAGIITGWNAEAERTFGWPREEALGRPMEDIIIPPQYREGHRRGLKHFLATGHGPVLNKRLEITGLHRDGHEFPIELAIAPVQREGAWHFSAFVRDITERKKAEETLRASEAEVRRLNLVLEQRVIERTAQLEAANKELEAFSYSVSHDLRAPLRHIDGFVAKLQKHLGSERLDDQSRRCLGIISESARGMGRLIDDLLAFAQIGRTPLRRSRVSLDELVAECRRTLQGEINGRTVAWEVAPLPAVEGDAALLRQVFANLIGNAVKYTGRCPEARIEIGTQPGAAGETVVFVRDNGAGFDMKHAGKLFGVFQRLHATSEFEGTGVGLATVQRIVQRHGGRIWAESAVNQGATFYFTLPAAGPPK